MENKTIGYYNYTVVLTYIGMLVGFLGISCVLSGKVPTALICLMFAGVCDMFDGAIASTKKDRTQDEKSFGIQIDSLSDLICFGILPALIVLKVNGNNEVAFAICGLYVLCALIRLAYYNVDEQNRQRVSTEGRDYFLGMPVTSIAIILPFFAEVAEILSVRKRTVSIITLFVVAILFITPFKLKKPKVAGKVIVAFCGILELVFLMVVGLGDV